MAASVLVSYATRSGSTGEVAKAIGDTLRQVGFPVEVLAMPKVESLAGKTTVILGAPLYIGRFPREFHRFLGRCRKELEPLKPWCFVLGPTRAVLSDFDGARKQAMKQLSRYPWLHAADVRIFGGKWDPVILPFPFSVARMLPMNPLNKIPAADIRDWAAIQEWAVGIAQQIVPAA